MAEHPMLFSTEMVKALLAGRKTQTRRLITERNSSSSAILKELDFSTARKDLFLKNHGTNIEYLKVSRPEDGTRHRVCPKYQPGDLLWVREVFRYIDFAGDENGYVYRASENGMDWEQNDENWKWKPSLHMPKVAARIWLEIQDVRVERVQDISEEDAVAEGVEPYTYSGRISFTAYKDYLERTPQSLDDILNAKESYQSLWESLHGIESWRSNPWIWVYNLSIVSTTGKPVTDKIEHK